MAGVNGYSYYEVQLGPSPGQATVIAGPVDFVTNVVMLFSVVPHGNGSDYWFIVQPRMANGFLAYRITEQGITTGPVVSQADYVNGEFDVLGAMCASVQGDRLVAYRVSNSFNDVTNTSAVELFSFDALTGAVGLIESFPDMKRIFGMEFSPNGRYLYLSTGGTSSISGKALRQYDLFQANIAASAIEVHYQVDQQSVSANDLALAPNGTIYYAHSALGAILGCITEPDMAAPSCGYFHECHTLAGPMSHLPFFVKHYHDDITVGVEEARHVAARIWPNPMETQAIMSVPLKEGPVQVEWRDAVGRLVRSSPATVQGGQMALDAAGLAAGQYTVVVRPNDGSRSTTVRLCVAP